MSNQQGFRSLSTFKKELHRLKSLFATVPKKDGQLLIRINSTERDEFIQLCEAMDTSAARELRKFIRSFMKKNQSADIHTKE